MFGNRRVEPFENRTKWSGFQIYFYQLAYKTIIKHTHNSDPNSDKDLQIN